MGAIDFDINRIIFRASTDGTLTTAALLRIIRSQHPGQKVVLDVVDYGVVDTLFEQNWESAQRIAMVNFGVLERNVARMMMIVLEIERAGHRIDAIIDEHGANYWHRIVGDRRFERLLVKPETRSEKKVASSGAVLRNALNGWCHDPHTIELLRAADDADHGRFRHPIADLCNRAIKGARALHNGKGNSHIVFMAERFSRAVEPNRRMREDLRAYDRLVAPGNAATLATLRTLAPGIVVVDRRGRYIDRTRLHLHILEAHNAQVVIFKEYFEGGVIAYRVCVDGFLPASRRIPLAKLVETAGITPLQPATGGYVIIRKDDLRHLLPQLQKAVTTKT